MCLLLSNWSSVVSDELYDELFRSLQRPQSPVEDVLVDNKVSLDCEPGDVASDISIRLLFDRLSAYDRVVSRTLLNDERFCSYHANPRAE